MWKVLKKKLFKVKRIMRKKRNKVKKKLKMEENRVWEIEKWMIFKRI